MNHIGSGFIMQNWHVFAGIMRSQGALMLVAALGSTLFGTVLAYYQQTAGEPRSVRGWVGFCVPRELLTHPSCRLDVYYFIVDMVIKSLLWAPLIIGQMAMAGAVYYGLTAVFGPHAQTQPGPALWLLLAALVVFMHDAAYFYSHYIEHRIRVLWELHKVHHSVEFLTLLSARRVHPVVEIFDDATIALFVGVALGVTCYAFQLQLRSVQIAGVDAYFAINMLSFQQLRHSHVRLTYGWLERVFMSPTQHQIHHSSEAHLWDKNFGRLLSVFDQIHGTMVYSEAATSFRLGLPDGEGKEYDSVLKLLFTPIRVIVIAPAVSLARSAWAAVRPGVADDVSSLAITQPPAAE